MMVVLNVVQLYKISPRSGHQIPIDPCGLLVLLIITILSKSFCYFGMFLERDYDFRESLH